MANVCVNCGAVETETRHLLNCSACKGRASIKYCSVQCQRQHWPMHKDICKLTAQAIADQKEGLRAMSAAERASFATERQWEQWASKAPTASPLTYLVHRVLGDRQDTHIAMLCVEVRPDQEPIFKVVSARAMPDAEAQRELRIPQERIPANRKQISGRCSAAADVPGGLVLGLVFFDDGRGKRPCNMIYGMPRVEAAPLSAMTTVDSWISKVNIASVVGNASVAGKASSSRTGT